MSRSKRQSGKTVSLVCRWSLCLLLTVTLSGCATLTGKGGLFGPKRTDRGLSAGDRAPTFVLKSLDDDTKRVKLASFRKDRPVVLFFGSYT